MRKILFCVCFLLVCCAVYAQHTGKYKVNGKIEGMESGQVVMKQKQQRDIMNWAFQT